jgi:hypothetical protein
MEVPKLGIAPGLEFYKFLWQQIPKSFFQFSFKKKPVEAYFL